MAKKVVIELTKAEAEAVFSLADCAGAEYPDALGVLGNHASVLAGYRAIEKIFIATHGEPRTYSRVEV